LRHSFAAVNGAFDDKIRVNADDFGNHRCGELKPQRSRNACALCGCGKQNDFISFFLNQRGKRGNQIRGNRIFALPCLAESPWNCAFAERHDVGFVAETFADREQFADSARFDDFNNQGFHR